MPRRASSGVFYPGNRRLVLLELLDVLTIRVGGIADYVRRVLPVERGFDLLLFAFGTILCLSATLNDS